MSEKPGQMNTVTLPDGWCQVKTSFYNELLDSHAEMLEALQTIKDRSGASGNNRHDKLIWAIADAAIQKIRGAQ